MEVEKKNIRVGVVGIGNIGSAHAKSIAKGEVHNMHLIALCDIDKQRCEALRKKYSSVQVYESYSEMLEDANLDAVIISTPHKFHPTMVKMALEKNIHVLSEKPIGVDCKKVEELYAVANHSKKIFAIMFNQRTNSLFVRARELIKTGRLGSLKRFTWIITNWYRPQWYYDSADWRATWNGEGGGVLLNQAPHNLDIWQWLIGMPTRIRAFCYRGKYHDIDVEDEATIYAEYDNGLTGTFITSTGEYPGTNRLEIAGDKGKIVVENGKLYFTELSLSEREYCFSGEEGITPKCTETVYADDCVPGHTAILRNFADAILFGANLIAPGTDGIFELMISNAAYLSSSIDDWVSIPFNTQQFSNLLKKLRETEKAKKQNPKAEQSVNGVYKERWSVQW